MRFLLLLLCVLPLMGQDVSVQVRDKPAEPFIRIEGDTVVAGCDIPERKEMVLRHAYAQIYSFIVPATDKLFSCSLSLRENSSETEPGDPLPAGTYRVMCAYDTVDCLKMHRCDVTGCTPESELP